MMKPWLWLSPTLAHKMAPMALKAMGVFASSLSKQSTFTFRQLHFPHRLGTAGGTDKNGDLSLAWQKWGAAFVEVGTVTPLPQEANPGLIMDRDISHLALWNKMGFPNDGAQAIYTRLKKSRPKIEVPLFLNIGRNRQTPNATAEEDYLQLIEKFHDLADAFVINISSPNTQALRDLFEAEKLTAFLAALQSKRKELCPKKLLLLKISPDLDAIELRTVLEVSSQAGLDGWVLTNTTTYKEGTAFAQHEGGGVSGRPLTATSRVTLREVIQILGPKRQGKLIISVGGVMTREDYLERLALGADLVQVYSALIFEGPFLFRAWKPAHFNSGEENH